jgi:putative FmdB family regulatory protein
MPTYGYECTTCKHQIEVFQSIKDDPLTICEECGGTLRKRIYPVGIAFKGSGFYVNDYGKTSPPSSAGGGSEPKSETKTETKTESTPAASAEAKPETPKTESTPKAEAAASS